MQPCLCYDYDLNVFPRTHLDERDDRIGQRGDAPGRVLTVGLCTASDLCYIWRTKTHKCVALLTRHPNETYTTGSKADRSNKTNRATRTALHHLSEGLHRRLLCALEAALRQQGADRHLQGAPPGHVVVISRAGG